jgi:hypothetical protein
VDVHKVIELSKNTCPCCSFTSSGGDSEILRSMYYLYTSFDPDENTQSHILPEKCLDHVLNLYNDGDVINTDEYRGVGLYICVKGSTISHFQQVPCGEYYPIWPLEYLKLRGYRYYLKFYEYYDELHFEDDIVLISGLNKFCPKSDKIDRHHIEYNEGDDFPDRPLRFDIARFEEVPYPFTSVDIVNNYSEQRSRKYARLNAEEILVFYDYELVLAKTNGRKPIYLLNQ